MSEDNDRVTVALIKADGAHTRKDLALLRADVKEWHKDHEKRIRVLEKLGNWRWFLEGGAVLLGAIGTALGLNKP